MFASIILCKESKNGEVIFIVMTTNVIFCKFFCIKIEKVWNFFQFWLG